jgi:hypothetical protein
MADENSIPLSVVHRRDDALHLGPRKKPYILSTSSLTSYRLVIFDFYRCLSDPLISHGRHFGRTIHALCDVKTLVTNGLARIDGSVDGLEEASAPECVNNHLELLPPF